MHRADLGPPEGDRQRFGDFRVAHPREGGLGAVGDEMEAPLRRLDGVVDVDNPAGRFMPRRTWKGGAVLAQIEGFRRFLAAAGKGAPPGPQITGSFEPYLPSYNFV